MTMLCPCHSGKTYEKCCASCHLGEPAKNAKALMRSRYAAYALELADYVNDTAAVKTSKEQILAFSRGTRFLGLEILDFEDGEEEATVTFRAILEPGGFTEKSLFRKVAGRWIYVSGTILH